MRESIRLRFGFIWLHLRILSPNWLIGFVNKLGRILYVEDGGVHVWFVNVLLYMAIVWCTNFYSVVYK